MGLLDSLLQQGASAFSALQQAVPTWAQQNPQQQEPTPAPTGGGGTATNTSGGQPSLIERVVSGSQQAAQRIGQTVSERSPLITATTLTVAPAVPVVAVAAGAGKVFTDLIAPPAPAQQARIQEMAPAGVEANKLYAVEFAPKPGTVEGGADWSRVQIVKGLALAKPELLAETVRFQTGVGSQFTGGQPFAKEGTYSYLGAAKVSQHGQANEGWLYKSTEGFYFLAEPAKQIIGLGTTRGQAVGMSGGSGAWEGMLSTGRTRIEPLLTSLGSGEIREVREAATGRLVPMGSAGKEETTALIPIRLAQPTGETTVSQTLRPSDFDLEVTRTLGGGPVSAALIGVSDFILGGRTMETVTSKPVAGGTLYETKITPIPSGFEIGEQEFSKQVSQKYLPEISTAGLKGTVMEYPAEFAGGMYQGIREKPLTAAVYTGAGILMAAGFEGVAGLGAATSLGTAGTRLYPIARGTELFATKIVPPALAVMYGVDVAGRTTAGFTDISPAAARRLGAITSTEIVPMTVGGLGWAYRERIGASAREAYRLGEVRFEQLGRTSRLSEEATLLPRKPAQKIELAKPMRELDLRESIDWSKATLSTEAPLAKIRTVDISPVTRAERAMMIQQYGITSEEIALAKTMKYSLNDLLSYRETTMKNLLQPMTVSRLSAPELRTVDLTAVEPIQVQSVRSMSAQRSAAMLKVEPVTASRSATAEISLSRIMGASKQRSASVIFIGEITGQRAGVRSRSAIAEIAGIADITTTSAASATRTSQRSKTARELVYSEIASLTETPRTKREIIYTEIPVTRAPQRTTTRFVPDETIFTPPKVPPPTTVPPRVTPPIIPPIIPTGSWWTGFGLGRGLGRWKSPYREVIPMDFRLVSSKRDRRWRW